MKIKHTNITNEILKHLKSSLVNGVWKPGEKIDTEMSLAQQLNVSRASIHCAIQRLVALGVLESYQGKGTYVKAISLPEIENRLNSLTRSVTLRKIMEFRLLVEPEICRNVVSYISDDILDEMEVCVQGMEASIYRAKKYAQYDFQFHRLLVSATQNDIIIQSLDIICEETQRQNIFYATNDSVLVAINRHKNILRCLRERDGEGAAQAMAEHFLDTPCDPPFDLSQKSAPFPLFSPDC